MYDYELIPSSVQTDAWTDKPQWIGELQDSVSDLPNATRAHRSMCKQAIRSRSWPDYFPMPQELFENEDGNIVAIWRYDNGHTMYMTLTDSHFEFAVGGST